MISSNITETTLPKVSVITVLYNDVRRVGLTLSSVASQDYPNLEYVIIDGGSTDGTLELIRNHHCPVARIISERDHGIYDAMNKGAALATGEWLVFLNAGDSFTYSSVIMDIFRSGEPEADVIYGSHMNNYGTYQTLIIARPIQEIRTTLPFCHQASLVRRRLLLSRPFDVRFRFISDFDFFRNAYYSGATFFRTDVVIANYSCNEGFSAEHLMRVYWENFRITADLPLLQRTARLFKKVIRAQVASIAKRVLPQTFSRRFRERKAARRNALT